MAEASVTTPGSNAESGTPAKYSAAKDRECPYCHASFTSSSLGRHLDVYIRETNPKPSDGMHDVEAIRRSRGNITRRQARTSSARRNGSTPLSARPPARQLEARSPSAIQHQRCTNGTNGMGPVIAGIKAPTLETTGVINDILGVTGDGKNLAGVMEARQSPVRAEIILRRRLVEEREEARAVELALRQLVDSVNAANTSLRPPEAFPFPFLEQNFPQICLRCLVPPPSINGSPVIPTSSSWTAEPPGLLQFNMIRVRVEIQINFCHRQHQIAMRADRRRSRSILSCSPDTSANANDDKADNNDNDERNSTSETTRKSHLQEHQSHLSTAYNLWIGLDDDARRHNWHLEVQRALAREQREHGDTHVRLERAETEMANLRVQLARLNECQQPCEYLAFPPNQLPVAKDVARMVAQMAPGSTMLVLDDLVGKWRRRVRAQGQKSRFKVVGERIGLGAAVRDERDGLDVGNMDLDANGAIDIDIDGEADADADADAEGEADETNDDDDNDDDDNDDDDDDLRDAQGEVEDDTTPHTSIAIRLDPPHPHSHSHSHLPPPPHHNTPIDPRIQANGPQDAANQRSTSRRAVPTTAAAAVVVAAKAREGALAMDLALASARSQGMKRKR